MKTKIPTRQEFNAAVSQLRQAGWEQRLTVMDDTKDKKPTDEFGILFARGEQRFWLNLFTIDTLPA